MIRSCGGESASRSALDTIAFFAIFSVAALFSTGAFAANTGNAALFTPAGSGAPVAFGDFIAGTNAGGLDTYYRYFIEVPPGTSQLNIDIFDPDVGAGGCLAENDGQRDKMRPLSGCTGGNNWNDTARYQLFDPSGSTVPTQFTTGDASSPGAWDNAWVPFYDSAGGGVATFQNLASTTVSFNTQNVTINVPAGTQQNDLLIASIARDGGGGSVINAPVGWTQINQGGSPGGGGGGIRLAVYYRVAGASEPASYTWNWSANQEVVGVILRYSGADTSNPIDVSGAQTGSSANPTAPSVTTTVNNTTILRLYGADDDDLSGSPYPPGHTGRYNLESGPGGGGTASGGGADTTQATAGATGSAAFSLSLPFPFEDESWRAVTVAITPAAGGPTPPAAGHWELRVDMSSAVTGGDDINAIGIRAYDGAGNEDTDGTELNVYAESYVNVGVNNTLPDPPNDDTRNYMLYPYITSGCTVDFNDWDMDSNSLPNASVMTHTSRTGGNTVTYRSDAGTLSDNNTWLNNSFTGWTTDTSANDYGIWTSDVTMAVYPNNGNYVAMYYGDENAADPIGNGGPPTSQPEPSTFRFYLPQDGADGDTTGGAPSKPYAAQEVTYVSGPNPPQMGQTTRVAITVRVTNPTPFPITFSATDLVTANVPGGGAVYAGNTQVSQGSITGEPSIGGTGDITWNPGTVAAGTTVAMSYQVDITPTATGQRIPLTGTPTANGTTAQYLDETANTGQARATYRHGPLCGLAVTEGVLTYVVITAFQAYSDGGKVVVQWDTAAEVGTIGFDLLRRDAQTGEFRKVNNELLPGLLSAPQGGTYRLVDPNAAAGETYAYKLVEVEANGSRREYGPYTVTVDGEAVVGTDNPATTVDQISIAATDRSVSSGVGRSLLISKKSSARTRRLSGGGGPKAGRQTKNSDDQEDGSELTPMQSDYDAKRHTISSLQKGRLEARKAARKKRTRKRPRGGAATEQAKIVVTENGLYYLEAGKIAEVLGLRLKKTKRLIARNRLRLTTQGSPVTYFPAAENAGLYFYGVGIDSLYTKENVYWLSRARGNKREKIKGRGATPVDNELTFTDTIHAEEDQMPVTVLPQGPDADYWYWRYVIAGNSSAGSQSFTLPAKGAAAAGQASLRINLQGFSNTTASPDHHAEVKVNGTSIGEGRWDGQNSYTLVLPFDQGLLNDGDNTVVVTGLLDSGVPYSIFYIDSFDLSYERHYRAINNVLHGRAAGNAVVTVEGFSSPDIAVYEISDPTRPKAVVDATVDSANGAYRVSFKPTSAAEEYLALTLDAVRTPITVLKDTLSDLKGRYNGADYVVITPTELAETAKRLANHRAGQGLKTVVVDLEDIYDEFNFGIANPRAIRDFLTYAYNNWTTAPRYVVLTGNGSFDYRDILGYGDNLLPPIMVSTPNGLYAGDNRYGDVAGNDGIPEIAVGRLPALTTAELDDVIDKIIAYETAASGDWDSRVLMAADGPDGSVDFPADSDRVAALIPTGYTTERIYLSEMAPATARDTLLQGINDGAVLLNYIGHGSTDRLAAEGLLVLGDVAALNNGAQLPVVTALTCMVGRFAPPGYASLGEMLVLQKDGGAIAVWAPTGFSYNAQAITLNEAFFGALFGGGAGERLGDAILKALKQYAGQSNLPHMLDIYTLLGDPALQIKTAGIS